MVGGWVDGQAPRYVGGDIDGGRGVQLIGEQRGRLGRVWLPVLPLTWA